MAATIGANGLSVVHKGSGGEANASVPDVCLTKVGKPVVPIPYGNNAKSSDLANGSTTVTADGGNSIALQGSKFSKSTGDAAGDKKGVSSGTIEGEAQFVTSSSNVLIEGKGVARQSDQMTMNNGNTMCFGVQNPSFLVEEDLEETFIMDVCVRHPNGQRLVNAPFKLSDEQGSTVYEATLDDKGRSDADPLKGGKVKLLVEESQDPFVVAPIRRENPRHVDSQSDDDFFNIASKGQRGFWQPTRIETVGTAWGSIGQTLSSDRYFQDMVSAEVIQHFTHYHPDTTFDVSKTCDALIGNLDQPLPHTTESLLAYTLPQVLEEGELLSVLLRLAPHETTDRMLAYMRARGKGNPQTYLADYDWQAAEKSINSELDALLNKLKSRLTFLRDEASKLQYAYLSEEVFDKHIDTLSSYMKQLPELIAGVFSKMQTKASELLANTDNVKVIKAADDLHSIESESIEAVVNTTKTIDTVEPFMNEVAGVIENVIPIYPVRYGYANFFDELMPAQAPPSMLEMSGATGLKDTGGYLLRLLREGWLYIKEESEEETAPFHIFKYAQTQTPTGVIEKFEKYYFTNEENAQEGLTLDTSSGSTFYPFAFVTPKAKKISIVYSEHEWSAAIIDNMNSDEELRKKAMQQVDLTAPQTDFSQAATQDNLSALVEDYRRSDEKWLALENNSQANPMGLDVFTTENNHYLSPLGIVETMQKSHSEKKDGTLVALFDPVGRQSDIAFVLSMLFGIEQSDQASEMYPKTIGEFILQLNHGSSDDAQIQAAINENIDVAALTEFYQQSREKSEALSALRVEYLELFSAFAYRDLADGAIGSLDGYLELFFDSQSAVEPFKELQKLNATMSAMFGSLGATKEGHNAVVSMINAAYEEGANNTYLTFEEKLMLILLQCQNNVDWAKLATELAENTPNVFQFLWSWTAAVAKYGQGHVVNSALQLRPVAYSGLLNFIPVFFEKGFGIKELDGTVRVTLDELGRILAKNIDSNGKNHFPMLKAQSALPFARTLITWGKREKAVTLPDWEKVAKKSPLPTLTMPNYSHRYVDYEGETTQALLGKTLDGILSMLSLRANIDVLMQLTQINGFEQADPTTPHNWVAPTQTLSTAVAAISAAIVDRAGAQRAQLLLANKALNSRYFYSAVRMGLPSLLAAATKGGAKLASAKIDTKLDHMKAANYAANLTRLIAVSNLALLVSSTAEAVDAYDSGNRGLMYANINRMISYSMFAAGPILTMRSISSATIQSGYFALIGFALLLVGEGMKVKYSKSALENLLFRCFWGKSEKYSFWDFEEEGDFDISQRLEFALKRYQEDKYQLALNIEQQEFMNILLCPELKVWIKEELSPTRKIYGYRMRLPGFTPGESNVIGAVCSTRQRPVDIMQPINKMVRYHAVENKSATQAFQQALNDAVNSDDFFKRELIDGMLHLNFEVEMESEDEETLNVHWYYQQSPEVVVPKRMLTSDGVLEKTYYGMVDDKPSSIGQDEK
ncbi:hypothetical protein VoSk93_46590 [Vibrio owensii]